MTDELNALRLAQLAGVADPDSATSAGAVFLTDTADAWAIVADELSEGDELTDRASLVSEQVDSLVGARMTHELWTAFVDLCAYDAVDLGELPEAPNPLASRDLTNCVVMPAMALVAEQLCAALTQRQRDAWERHAAFLGDDAGAAAGALVILSDDAAHRVISDGHAWAALGADAGPNLSGEYADDATPDTLADELSVPPCDRADGYTVSELCDAWEERASAAFNSRVHAVALRTLGRVSEALTVERAADAVSARLRADHEGTDSERRSRELDDELSAARERADAERNGR